MGIATTIEWCDSSVNPMMGCDGCELWKPGDGGTCYAGVDVTKKAGGNSGMPAEFHKPEIYPYRLLDALKWPDLTGAKRPGKPWLDGLPRMIFLDDYGDTYTQSLDDWGYVLGVHARAAGGKGSKRLREPESMRLLDESVTAVCRGGHWLDPYVPLMEASPHIWLFLTKRPGRMRRAFDHLGRVPRNFWPMTSITRSGQLGRVRQLLEIGDEKTIHGISFEPIYGEVDFGELLSGVSWLIAGGESGHGARPCHLEWIDSVVEQCREAGARPYTKQLGSVPIIREARPGEHPLAPDREWPEGTRFGNRTGARELNGRQALLRDKKGGAPEEWPGGLERFPREMPSP